MAALSVSLLSGHPEDVAEEAASAYKDVEVVTAARRPWSGRFAA